MKWDNALVHHSGYNTVIDNHHNNSSSRYTPGWLQGCLTAWRLGLHDAPFLCWKGTNTGSKPLNNHREGLAALCGKGEGPLPCYTITAPSWIYKPERWYTTCSQKGYSHCLLVLEWPHHRFFGYYHFFKKSLFSFIRCQLYSQCIKSINVLNIRKALKYFSCHLL